MGILDRDWYQGEQKSSYTEDNRRISREEAEKLRRMMEGNANEPPKVEPKYQFEFAGSPIRSKNQSSNTYDPNYGYGYESSSTVKQYKNHGLRVKPLSFIILAAAIGYIIAVGYNVLSVSKNLNEEFLRKNSFSIGFELCQKFYKCLKSGGSDYLYDFS